MEEKEMLWQNRRRRQRRSAESQPAKENSRLIHPDKLSPIRVGDTLTLHPPGKEAYELRVTASTPEYIGKKKGDLVLVEGSFLLIEHVR